MTGYTLVKNGLVQDPKHRQKMGEAIYLYLFYLSFANSNGGQDLIFYPASYIKSQKVDKDWWRSNHKLLETEGYVMSKYVDDSRLAVKILKPLLR